MRLIKKTVAVFLALCCLLALPAYAAQSAATSVAGIERYTGLAGRSVLLQTKDSSCGITVKVDVRPGYHASVSFTLEERAPGGSWHPVKTWNESTSATQLVAEKQHPGTSGYAYRVTYHIQVYDAANHLADDITNTTAEKTMP